MVLMHSSSSSCASSVCSASEAATRLRALSPMSQVQNIDVPLLVAHGDLDTNVPFGEATQVVAALRELGRPVDLLVLEGEGHEYRRAASRRWSCWRPAGRCSRSPHRPCRWRAARPGSWERKAWGGEGERPRQTSERCAWEGRWLPRTRRLDITSANL